MFSGNTITEMDLAISSDSGEVLESVLELILKKHNIAGYYFSQDGELCFCESTMLSCSIFTTPPSAESLKLLILEWLGGLEIPQSVSSRRGSVEKGWLLIKDTECMSPPTIFEVSPTWLTYDK